MSERFGCVVVKQKNDLYSKNWKEIQIKNICQKLRALKKQNKRASSKDKLPLVELREFLRCKLKSIWRAEWHRRRGKEKARKQAAFISNPLFFPRSRLEISGAVSWNVQKKNSKLSWGVHSDPRRGIEHNNDSFIISPATLSIGFNSEVPSWSEIQEVVKALRSASAPGPIQYPNILRRLWWILRVIWTRNRVADQWRYSERGWIPKEENSVEIEQFRIISLLDTECKIFFSILSHHLTKYFIENEYIDKSVQKGDIQRIPDCIEHTGMVTLLLREAKEGNGDLAVLWLDLANANGSILHKLNEEALKWYHIPSATWNLLCDYYAKFYIRTTAGVAVTLPPSPPHTLTFF